MDTFDVGFNPNREKEKKKRKIGAIIFVISLWVICGIVVFIGKGGLKKEKDPIPYDEIDFSTDDISSLEFAVDGHVFTFPITVADLEKIGYKVKDKYKKEVIPGMNGYMYYSMSASAVSDFNSEVSFSACNLTETSKRVTECGIESIFARDEHFVLCNGITLSTSYDEVIAIMGKPTKEEEGYQSKTLTYDIDGGFSIYIEYLHNNFDEMDTLMIHQKW